MNLSSHVAIISFSFWSPLLKSFLREGQSDLIWLDFLHSKHLTCLKLSPCWKFINKLIGPLLFLSNLLTLLVWTVNFSSSSSENLLSMFSTLEYATEFGASEWCLVLVFEMLWVLLFSFWVAADHHQLLFMNIQWPISLSIARFFNYLGFVMASDFWSPDFC